MNTQTKILLISVHHNSDAYQVNNILTMVLCKELPVAISDVMYAYMIAEDWIKWIKDPNSSDDSPLRGKSAEDVAPLLKLFQRQAYDLATKLTLCKNDVEEMKLTLCKNDVEEIFENLNPCLINNWRSRDDLTRETTKMFHRSLRLTAKLFAEQGDDSFNEILEEKLVPPMS